jgi:hypothetical protein
MPRIEPRLPGRPARSQTLYRLSYPAYSDICCLYQIRNLYHTGINVCRQKQTLYWCPAVTHNCDIYVHRQYIWKWRYLSKVSLLLTRIFNFLQAFRCCSFGSYNFTAETSTIFLDVILSHHHHHHHHMALQPNSGPGRLFWVFVTITFLQGWIVSPAPNPQPGGPGLRIYDPWGQGDPAIPPGTG